MTAHAPSTHERGVISRFDALHARFKDRVEPDDVRLRAILDALGPVAGRRILDLGCGKGRFAARLREQGAEVIGLDPSHAMLAHASGCPRVRGTGRNLPFAGGTFDAAIAVEVFEHIEDIAPVLRELRRILRPGGVLAILDKNAGALDARRPWLPSLVIKWLDERRGRWMYPPGYPARERWFRPRRLARSIGDHFESVQVAYLLSPREARSALFRRAPRFRLLVLWQARRADTRDG